MGPKLFLKKLFQDAIPTSVTTVLPSMNMTSIESNYTQIETAATPVSEVQLSARQIEFLQRVRKHDPSVKVFAQGEQLAFAGRSLSGLMPTESTITDENDGGEE